MTVPKGLKFRDRLAAFPAIDGYLFVCQRRPHPPLQKYLENYYKADAQDFRNAHDLAYHNAMLQESGYRPERNVGIGELLDEWLAHNEALEVEKSLHPMTVRWYSYLCVHLKAAFAAVKCRTVLDIDPSVISKVIHWFKKNTGSKGSITKAALSTLRTAIHWKGLPATWPIPAREIGLVRREKRDVDSATIQRLIAAMPPDSLQYVCALLKARTGARDVEVYEAQPEDFQLAVPLQRGEETITIGLWRPNLHNKRKQRRHVYALTASVVAVVRPWVVSSRAGERMFRIDGRPIDRASLRKRLRRASADAKPEPITPWIESLGPIRSEIATLIIDEHGPEAEEDFVGHSAEVAAKWYQKDRLTTRKILERLHIAETLELAIPLRKVG
jgi:hypothetical protein